MEIEEALSTIREYESSIKRPEAASWVPGRTAGKRGDKGGRIADRAYPEGGKKRRQYIEYAEKCVDYLRYGYEVDACVAGLLPRYEDVLVRKGTPEILQELGCSDLPMLKTQRHLKNEMHAKKASVPAFHGLERAEVKEIAELLEKPCIVMDSLSERGGIVMVLDMLDADDVPIIAPFVPDGMGSYQSQGIASNFILSMYGKNGIASYVSRAQQTGKLLYIDRDKTKSLMSCAGLRLPRACMRLDGIIHQSGEVGLARPQRQPNKQTLKRHPMPKVHAPRAGNQKSVRESVEQAKGAAHNNHRQQRRRSKDRRPKSPNR